MNYLKAKKRTNLTTYKLYIIICIIIYITKDKLLWL